MTSRPKGLLSNYDDILDGVRTAFADYNTVLGLVSPIDLGIKVARDVFRCSAVSPADVDAVIAGNSAARSQLQPHDGRNCRGPGQATQSLARGG